MASQWTDIPGKASARWKSPVANSAALPATGNTAGDARVTLDTQFIYVWSGSAWTLAGGGAGGGTGTVTSVGLAAPNLFTVTGSPVTTSGTLTLSFGAGVVPLANGGWGQSEAATTISTTGNIAALSPTTGFIIMTGAAPVIQGVVSDGTEKRVTILYRGSGTLILSTENGSATAANRLHLPSSASFFTVASDTSVTLIYYPTASRWCLDEFYVVPAGTADQVIVTNTTGIPVFSLPQSINTGANVQFNSILDSGGSITAIDITNRQLIHASGGVLVDWSGSNLFLAGQSWPTAYPVGTTYLANDGSGTLNWTAIALSPGGSSGTVQYNNAGVLDGISPFTYDGVNLTFDFSILQNFVMSGLSSNNVLILGSSSELKLPNTGPVDGMVLTFTGAIPDWDTALRDAGHVLVLDIYNRTLANASGSTIIDFANAWANDGVGTLSQDFNARNLLASDGTTVTYNYGPLVSPGGVTTSGFTANTSANAVFAESTFTGGVGGNAYTISDIVALLKYRGVLQ